MPRSVAAGSFQTSSCLKTPLVSEVGWWFLYPVRGVLKTTLPHRKTAVRCERMKTQTLVGRGFSGMTAAASGRGLHLQGESHSFPIPSPLPWFSPLSLYLGKGVKITSVEWTDKSPLGKWNDPLISPVTTKVLTELMAAHLNHRKYII